MSELEEQMIDLTIEALTGTVYDLCVSPFETILGIKMKIQRLEGIPVYQQQLVHGSVELQDELCLEEYGISSGAQLKLLVAMRGGPIHAHRVQLDEPGLVEIAELLEFDHRYTVMLLRDGDTMEVADLVQVVGEDSPEHVSPQQSTSSGSSEQQAVVAAAPNRMVQLEHAMTRDKMKDVIHKLRKLRPYRKQQTEATVRTGHSGTQLNSSGMAKVLILGNGSSSRLVRSSAPSPLTPIRRECNTPTNAQRKLVFPSNKKSTAESSSEPQTTYDGCPPQHKHLSGLKQLPAECSSRVSPSPSTPHFPHHHQHRQWRRKRRLRRASCLEDKQTSRQEVGELTEQLTDLALQKRGVCGVTGRGHTLVPCLPPVPTSSYPHHARRPLPTHTSSSTALPPISAAATDSNTAHKTRGRGWDGGHGRGRSHCLMCGKRTGLASTYTCRCGGVFCALHRYSEAHSCSFDYKTQGRDVIARGNPLVIAPKLPKI